MLFVFLALYVVLGIGCVVVGVRSHSRTALICGIFTLGLAVVSFAVWLLSEMGASHWSVSLLEALLSPMPESLLQPDSLGEATAGSGVPTLAIAALELIVAIVLWAIPVLGLVVASRARQAPAP
ncbi:MAG: hypothetical protein ABWY26_08760 [Microbacterium sp.]